MERATEYYPTTQSRSTRRVLLDLDAGSYDIVSCSFGDLDAVRRAARAALNAAAFALDRDADAHQSALRDASGGT